MTSDYKIVLGAVSALLSFAAHIPYIVTLIRGTNRPHIFTWVIWTLLGTIGWAAQVAGGAGAGAWSTGITALLCVIITALTIRRGEKDITTSDWAMFVCGLASIPIWAFTANPLGAVLLITLVDALAFGPTIRKSWHAPHNENITMYAVNIARHIITLAAIAHYSLVTTLYIAMLLVMNTLTCAMLVYRRRQTPA